MGEDPAAAHKDRCCLTVVWKKM